MSGISSYGNDLYSKNINPASLDIHPANLDINDVIYIGIEPVACPSMKESINKGFPVELVPFDNFVDGATVSRVGDETFNICKNTINDIYTIQNGKICETMIDLYQEDGIIAEPAGALSVSV